MCFRFAFAPYENKHAFPPHTHEHFLAPNEIETFLCTKSVTLGGGEHKIVEFYMPSPALAVIIDFNISRGTVKHHPEPPSYFDSNQTYFEQFMEEVPPIEADNGIIRGGWSTTVDGDIDRLNRKYTGQMWYL